MKKEEKKSGPEKEEAESIDAHYKKIEAICLKRKREWACETVRPKLVSICLIALSVLVLDQKIDLRRLEQDSTCKDLIEKKIYKF